jgi:hypothetical protein
MAKEKIVIEVPVFFNRDVKGSIMVTSNNNLWIKVDKNDLKRNPKLKEYMKEACSLPDHQEDSGDDIIFKDNNASFKRYNIISAIDAIRAAGIGVKFRN